MALVHLNISYDAPTDYVKADIYINGQYVEGKNLTNVEMDGLSDHIDFTKGTQSLSAAEVYRWVTEECWFDTEGEPTNLELLLEEYVSP